MSTSSSAYPVVKVRGNAGERRSWAPKIAGERSQAHTAVNGTSRLRGAHIHHTVGPQIFQSSWAPNLYLNHCAYPGESFAQEQKLMRAFLRAWHRAHRHAPAWAVTSFCSVLRCMGDLRPAMCRPTANRRMRE